MGQVLPGWHPESAVQPAQAVPTAWVRARLAGDPTWIRIVWDFPGLFVLGLLLFTFIEKNPQLKPRIAAWLYLQEAEGDILALAESCLSLAFIFTEPGVQAATGICK